ncbi:hypothetical protein EMCRGX_G024606 [Ephydatia muelleri]
MTDDGLRCSQGDISDSNVAAHCREPTLDRVRILEHQVNELMYVNSQWDVEYGEQKEAFRRFRTDSQLAQKENQETIARLRAENALLKNQIRAQETNHSGKEPATTVKRQRPTDLPLKVARDLPAASSVEVQTEIALLRHQLKAFQEDFISERREKEKITDQKRNECLRFQAEITSLQLQLDRCKTELAHYSKEATRLALQLNLRVQMGQRCASKGHIPRSPDTSLPPLDPVVENDRTCLVHPPIIQASNVSHPSIGRGVPLQVPALDFDPHRDPIRAMAAAITQERARQYTHELVDHINHTLRDNTKITPSEVIVGGSLGQGTAVLGKFDIDLVIYTRGTTSPQITSLGRAVVNFQDLGGGYLLKRLDEYLKETLKDYYHKPAITRYSIIFMYRGIIEVDLLLSPWWDAPCNFYRFLQTIPAKIRPRDMSPQAESKVVELTREKAEFESHLEEDQEEMEELIEKQRSLNSQIGTLQSQLSEANMHVMELEDAKHSLEKKVAQMNATIAELENGVNKHQYEVSEMKVRKECPKLNTRS